MSAALSSASIGDLRRSPVEEIVAAIVGFLQNGGLHADYLIDAFPDDPDKFDLGKAKRVALVQYTGSRYAPAQGTGTAQMRTPEFAIHLYLRSVGDPIRAPYEIDILRMAIQEQSVQGTTLSITRDGLMEQSGGLWRYLIEIAGTPIPAPPLTMARHAPTPIPLTPAKGG